MNGHQLREEGQAIALAHSGQQWVNTMLSNLQAFCKVRKDMGTPNFKLEDFRNVAEQRDWPMPKHQNSWGALANIAIKRGIIASTGRYECAKRVLAHGRVVRVWQAL